MKSLRIDSELERRLARAAAARGETVSEFIRVAAAARADLVLGGEAVDWGDVLGAVHSPGGQARRSGEVFADLVAGRSARVER